MGDAPTQAVTDAPTPAPEENATAAPTPAPEENENATRRLASGDMTVSARFTDVPDAVTKALVESKASEIEAAINTALTSQGITISGLSATATDTSAPTPAPFLSPTPADAGTGSGAFGARLDVSAAALLL